MTLRWFTVCFIANFLIGMAISFVAPSIVIFSGLWWLKLVIQGALGFWAAEIDENYRLSKKRGEHG